MARNNQISVTMKTPCLSWLNNSMVAILLCSQNVYTHYHARINKYCYRGTLFVALQFSS